jgi:large subunit ribosomal protein L15
MKIHELTLTATPDRKRVGRGIGSGYGKTAGRGTKGQNARTGGGVRPGFAGGQNPLAKLLPKLRGFKPLNQTRYQVVNIADLSKWPVDKDITPVALAEAGLVKKADSAIKLLGSGSIESKLTVHIHAASKSAVSAIENAGGSIEIIAMPKFAGKKATRPVSPDTSKVA